MEESTRLFIEQMDKELLDTKDSCWNCKRSEAKTEYKGVKVCYDCARVM